MKKQDFKPNDWQGKKKYQVIFNGVMCYAVLIGIPLLLIIMLITNS